MKKQIVKITRATLTALMVLFTAGSTMAQVHQIGLSMQNLTNPTPNTVEFELWINNLTVDSASNLSFLQFGMDIPPAIINGGALSFSKIAWNPALPASQQAQTSGIAVTGGSSAPHVRAAAQTTTSGLAAALSSSGNGTYYATYRITNTQPFTANSLLTFTPTVNTVSGKQRTLVAAYVNGASSGGSAFSVQGSTPIQSALRQLVIAPLPTLILNVPQNVCPTAGSAQVIDPTCFGGTGSADITLTPAPSPLGGTYSVDGGAGGSYTTNPFNVAGLSQGSHTITVTNASCPPFDVVLTVGGPSAPPPPPSLACYETATFNSTTCQWDVTGSMPAMPTLACYETASFNNTTCSWDVTGSMPAMPTLACYETASFNNNTCSWDVTGSMPAMPTLACYETASFNSTTCQWDVTGSMPAMPSLACYETASFNNNTCQWDVTGSMPAMPSLACYETASFNTATCAWDVTGSMPAPPTGLACYETASFNNNTCSWDVTGSMPAMPSLACYETASFNSTTCQWDVTGSMPAMPTLACYETASFNNNTCSWDVTGSMPAMPTLACYETASFNSTTCQWDVTGSMPAMPTLACYETASFNNTTCSWDVTGSMPAMPTLACYETASFNSTTCQWDVTGSMPAMPTLACYETASFNSTTCSWDVTGSMPAMPSLACYETASFNNNTCSWDVTGSMPAMPTLACYETASFNNATCSWDVTGSMPAMPTLACYETASFNNNTCSWDVTGSMPAMPSLACYETASFNTTTCQWDVTGSPAAPITTTYTGCDSYTWAVNNMNYTSTGTYTVNIGCQDYILYLTLGQSTSSTIVITQPVSYTWSCNNTTYTTSGTYTCTGVNASGCPDVQTLILTIGGCNLNVTAANVSGCPGSPINLSGTPAGGSFSVPNPYVGPSTTYTYTYTDPNTGCTGTATGTITVANLAAVTITSVVVTGPTTATVNWNPVAGLGWYEVRYRPVGSSSWTGGGTQAAPTSSKNLTGLTAGTTYEVEVRGFCSIGNPGPWGSNTVFTTAAPCGTPGGLFAAPVTGTTAKLNWTAVAGAAYYQVRYRVVGAGSWTSGGTQAAPATAKTITGLALATNYEWQVRAVCTGNAAGAWSAVDAFMTLSSKQAVDMETATLENNVIVYPNPVRDVLTVEVSSDVAQNTVVKVFDMSGRLVKQIQANAEIGINTLTVNLSDVASGVYQVQVFANDKLTHISKVNKQD